MASWIKMRNELWDHPKVVRIVSAICPQGVRDLSLKCRVIGALFRTWSLADTHTVDGILDGYDAEALNAAVGIDGWAQSLQHVGWLEVEPQRLIVPRFMEHNGESAKRRADDAARKKRVRKMSAECPQNVRKDSDKMRTRIEKNRIDKSNKKTPISPLAVSKPEDANFTAFWQAFPSGRKGGKGAARAAWEKAILKTAPEVIIAAAVEYAASPVGRGEYVKGPAPWLNGECWEDDRESWNRHQSTGKTIVVTPKPRAATPEELKRYHPVHGILPEGSVINNG